MPLASYYEGTVPLSSRAASVSCGSARVLAMHTGGAEVAVVVMVMVVVGVAVGVVAVVMGAAMGAVVGMT